MSLFFVLQIVLRRSFQYNKRIQQEPCTQPETGDKAIQGIVAVVGESGVGEVREAFLLLTGEMLGQPVLVLADRPQLAPDALVILKAAVLRFDIAVIELLDNAFISFLLHFFRRNPCAFCLKTWVLQRF